MSDWYRLDENNNPVKLNVDWTNPKSVALQLKHMPKRTVETTIIPGYWVSTVFLGLDHSFDGGPPLLFETMVFHHDGDQVTDWSEVDCDRYSTWDEAKAGHAACVEKWRHKEI